MRTNTKNLYDISELVAGFEDSDARELLKRPKAIPHCDCQGNLDKGQMKPVATMADDHMLCAHCGHVAPLMVPNQIKQALGKYNTVHPKQRRKPLRRSSDEGVSK